MNANEIYNDVLENIFELKNNGESNVVFGEKITDTFNVSFTSENEVSVEYLGKTNKVQLPKSIDTISDKLLSKYNNKIPPILYRERKRLRDRLFLLRS